MAAGTYLKKLINSESQSESTAVCATALLLRCVYFFLTLRSLPLRWSVYCGLFEDQAVQLLHLSLFAVAEPEVLAGSSNRFLNTFDIVCRKVYL